MSQLITITSAHALTKEARDEVRKDVEDQLKGCDVRVLFLAPGLMMQHVPQLPFLAPIPPTTQQSSWTLGGEPLSPEQIDKIQREERKAVHEYMQVNRENRHPLAQREVQHLDTDEQDEEPAGVLPPHVWLYRNMLTDLQAPLGVDTTNGQVAVAIDQLSDEQRAIPHIARQMNPTDTYDKPSPSANAKDSQNQPEK